MRRKLVLENGLEFNGIGFGSSNEAICELHFNTSVVGYQEILSDPANYKEMICMTYPVVGSYGLTDEDYESKGLTIGGLICKEYNDEPSNFRYTHKLGEVMDEEGIPGIMDIDTRELTRIIRDNGTMKAMICDANKPLAEALKEIKGYSLVNKPALEVSSKKVWHSRTTNPLYTVVCVDCGLKRSIIKTLNKLSCNVVVVPMTITLDEILKYKPTGLLISDGPGNPNELSDAIELIKSARGVMPILGIGMGQELVGLAYGLRTKKEMVGHHGCNLPVRNIETGKIEITAQNSFYTIDLEESSSELKLTHENVIDKAPMGFQDLENSVITIKYSPSEDFKNSDNVFNRFKGLMKSFGGVKNAKKNRY